MLLASCDHPAIDPSQSLVGAKSLPTTSELNKETIELYYDRDKSLTRQLSYELKPDNSWSIVIMEPGTGREFSRRTFPQSDTRANVIRKKLWRLRPEQLDGVAADHFPADCPPQPTGTIGDLAIGFIREGSKPGVDDDQIGVFTLPEIENCRTRDSLAARRIIDDVMRSMPGAGLRSQYAYWPPLL